MKKLSLFLLSFSLLGHLHSEDVQKALIGPFGTLSNYDNSLVIPAEKAQDLLNVDISPQGKSVKKRDGYAQAFALAVTTAATHGVYRFFDSSGNEVILAFNDNRISSSINGNAPNVIGTGPNGATYQCVDSQGFAYCNNTSRTILIKTDGVTLSSVTNVNSTGTLVAVTPDRLVTAGFSGAQNRIDYSASADFTRWIQPFSFGTDPNQTTITAPGSRITHIVYAFGRLMWFKDSSFGYVLFGPSLLDWQVRTVSPVIGSLDNTSIYWNDVLYWRAQDGHFYSYDGSNLERMSRDITPTILSLQNRISNSWTQTTQADFDAGINIGFTRSTVTANAIALETATAISPFQDSVSSDFLAGTMVNVSTTAFGSDDSIVLNYDTEIYLSSAQLSSSNGACTSCGTNSKAFYSTTTSAIGTSVTLRLIKTGSPGDYTVRLATNNAGSPGTVLASAILTNGSVGTSTTNINVILTSIKLTVGTTFWIQLVPNGTCNSTNNIGWVGLGFVGSSSFDLCGGSAGSIVFGLATFGKGFVPMGSLLSRSFDVGFTTDTWIWSWDTFNSSTTIFGNSAITYETQTSSSSSGGFDSLLSVSTGTRIASATKEFIRYKATLTTIDISTSPVLSQATINMTSRLKPGGTFYSQLHNAPNLTTWDSFTATVVGSTFSHTFNIRSATNTFTILSSTPTWTNLLNGSIPTTSTGTFFQIRDMIVTTTTVNGNPTLNDFTQNWFEGSATDKIYGGYFDYALWWNVQDNQASYNDKIIKYDMINNGFTVYDIPMNGFYVRNGSLYFGSSSGGYIYKYGGVDSDNGSAINSYWKSKDFINGEGPFNDDEFVRLSLLTSSVQNSSMTVTYSIDGSVSTSFVMPLNAVNSSFRYKNMNLPAGRSGTTFNLKFGNNAIDQPFEVFGVQYGYRENPWIVKP